MSEEIKTEPLEDEENLKTTPVRLTLQDCENAQKSIDEQDKGQEQEQTQTDVNQIDAIVEDDTNMTTEVKTEAEESFGAKNEEAQEIEPVIKTLPTNSAAELELGKTPDMQNQKLTSETINLNNKVIDNSEPIGRKKLFADPTGVNVTIGTFRVIVEPPLPKEVTSEPVGFVKPTQEPSQEMIATNNLEKMLQKEFELMLDTPEAQLEAMLASSETTVVNVKNDPDMENNDISDIAKTLQESPSISKPVAEPEISAPPEATGNETPRIPHVPIKTELERLDEPMDMEETQVSPPPTETETQPPPPPPMTSSIVRDAIDGTATPRITVAPMSRLRVKTEFSLIPSTPQHPSRDTSALPQDFFEDLLTIEKQCESGEVTPTHSDTKSQDENIPDHFFDDLLRDKITERIEEARNDDLEEKYSDRLKELENLESRERERKKNKKQKKSKKKSHKRSRSRSPPPSRERERERSRDNRSPSQNYLRNKRSRVSPPSPPPPTFNRQTSTSNYGNLNKINAEYYPTTSKGLKVKSEFHTMDVIDLDRGFNNDVEMLINPAVKVEPPPPVINCVEIEEIQEVLTQKQKRERAMMRASALINHLKNMSSDTNSSPVLSTFQFTSTVRKLPASHSYVHQQIYENRSPLHTVNNVNYKFNSHATRFNLEEWGLATLPPHAAKIAKLVGFDALAIHNKLKTIKIPAKLQKMNTESKDQGEKVDETTSSFFCNVMTQTDDVEELSKRKAKGYEIGVQVEPSVCNMGCQTLETQSPTKNNQRDPDELPIMKILHDLNENQLMAIHDFAELIKEPAANAMDMYALRMRMLDIYKCSQLPSALATAPPQPQAINNYTTSMPSRNSPTTQRRPQIKQPIIQSVASADGTMFSINDPRAKSAAYAKRGDPRLAQPSASSESRNYSTSPSSSSRPHSSNQPQKPPPITSATTKYYGRGGLRRQ